MVKSWLNAAYDKIIDEYYPPRLAGAGPLSDGVPRFVGDGGDSEIIMPGPPRTSTKLESDDTQPMRKPCLI